MIVLVLVLPILLAVGLVAALKRGALALFVATCFCVLATLPRGGDLGESPVLEPIFRAFSPGYLTLLLLAAGMQLLVSGPAGGALASAVGRIADPGRRTIAASFLGALGGIGASTGAVQLAASGAGPVGMAGALGVVGLANAAGLIVPTSGFWVGNLPLLSPEEPLAVARGLLAPAAFVLCVAAWIVLGSLAETRKARRTFRVRAFLRTARPATPLWRWAFWAAMLGPLILAPPLYGIFVPGGASGPYFLPAWIAAATAFVAGGAVLGDVATPLQPLWGGAAPTASRPRAVPVRAVGGVLVPTRVEDAEALVFPAHDSGRRRSARVRWAILRQWELWQGRFRSTVDTVLLLLVARAFGGAYEGLTRAYGASLVDVVPLLGPDGTPRWTLVALGVAGAAFGIGLVIGTSFGTFALVASLFGPALMAGGHLRPGSWGVVGLLATAACAANTCSPQADNVQLGAEALGGDATALSRRLLPPVALALALATVAIAAREAL